MHIKHGHRIPYSGHIVGPIKVPIVGLRRIVASQPEGEEWNHEGGQQVFFFCASSYTDHSLQTIGATVPFGIQWWFDATCGQKFMAFRC